MSDQGEFKPPTNEEIIEILNLVNETDIEELHLEVGGLKLMISKRSMSRSDLQASPPPPRVTGEASSPGPAIPETLPGGPPPQLHEAMAESDEEEGLVPIKAPLLGIFYQAPKPGAPPFVKPGTQITEEDTVCLIEVMKCFNTVKAGVKGRVVKVCAENNQMVEYNQTLFLIDPEETPEGS